MIVRAAVLLLCGAISPFHSLTDLPLVVAADSVLDDLYLNESSSLLLELRDGARRLGDQVPRDADTLLGSARRHRRFAALGKKGIADQNAQEWYWDVASGACTRDGASLWDKVPDSACKMSTCAMAVKLGSCVSLHQEDATKPLQPKDKTTCAGCPSLGRNIGDVYVSFIYTLYKSPDMAVKSIVSVLRTLHELRGRRSEIVIVDDKSPVDMGTVTDLVDKMKNWLGYSVTFVQNEENKGYGASNNIALRHAKGRYAMFMNSDVTVKAGWLISLITTMETYPRAGMVGPLMLNAAGKVQEAGGTVMQYGKPSNFGRNSDPSSLPYLHARAADYISAACLLVKRELFMKLGLFDPQFEPAYYEDTDAALKHLQAGYLTIIQPFSVVLHEEGQSIMSDAKEQLMVRNQKRFYDQHKNLLDNFCPDVSCANHFRLIAEAFCAHSREATHVLVLDTHVPRPDRDSGSLRTTRMMDILMKQGYKVSLSFLDYFDTDLKYVLSLLASGIYVQQRAVLTRMLRWHSSVRPGMDAECPWDVILVTKPRAYVVVNTIIRVLCHHVPVVYDLTDAFFLNKPGTQLTAENQKGSEKETQLRLIKLSAATLLVNYEEAMAVRRLAPEAYVEVISNIYPRPDYGPPTIPFAERKGVLFVGNMCHEPNRQAAQFIFNEILGTNVLDFEITMVLSNAGRCGGIPQGATITAGLNVLWDVDEATLAALHDRALAIIAPLKAGNGVKGKVTYALQRGTPVIGTKIAADGLHAVDKTHVVLAETGLEFRAAVAMLRWDETLWNTLRENGKKLVEKYFSVDVASQRMVRVLDKLGFQSPILSPQVPRKCPGVEGGKPLPESCNGCWYCGTNPHYYVTPVP